MWPCQRQPSSSIAAIVIGVFSSGTYIAAVAVVVTVVVAVAVQIVEVLAVAAAGTVALLCSYY